MIVTQYRTTAVCDTCGKSVVTDTTTTPQSGVPDKWIQTAPSGISAVKEFCSVECLAGWKNPIKPWAGDDK